MITETAIKTNDVAEIAKDAYVVPDSWSYGQCLAESVYGMLGLRSNAASEVQGREVILPLSRIEITSRRIQWGGDGPKVRARLTFWDEDEGETTTGAWVFLGL